MQARRREVAIGFFSSVQAGGNVVETGAAVVDENVVFFLRPDMEEGGSGEVEEGNGRAEVTVGIVSVGPSAKGMWCGTA